MTKKKPKNLLEQRRVDEMEDLITQSEAAELSGRSLASINNLVRRGRLRSKEVFGKKLVYRLEVLTFEKEKPGPKTEEK